MPKGNTASDDSAVPRALPAHIAHMERYCAQHYLTSISARDVYEACQLAPNYGATLYRQHRGRTLTDFLTSLRVRHAVGLLREGGAGPDAHAVCDIALVSGFRSVSRFYEAFKIHAGQTPGELLESQSQGDAAATPAVEAGRTAAAAASRAPRDKSRHLWALWVDDAPLNNIAERRAMADLGIFTDCFTTNPQAHAALRLASYDLIVSDVRRAGSCETGWEFAAELTRSPSSKGRAQPPLIFYSSFADPQRRKLARQLNAASFCTQPDELLSAVSQHVAPANP